MKINMGCGNCRVEGYLNVDKYDNASVVIHVPHPRHDNYVGDPTHVRSIMAQAPLLRADGMIA